MAFLLRAPSVGGALASVVVLAVAALALLLAAEAYNPYTDDPATQYVMVRTSADPNEPEAARCIGNNRCKGTRLRCPRECPKRADTRPGKCACFMDCSPKCETSCKHRKPNCYGYASVCYDPRFVGGDGIMFYFHGKAGQDFCLVNDRNLHINAHFIGLRPEGRKRDYTWVQGLGIRYGAGHSFSISVKKVAAWDASVDQLLFAYDGQEFALPAGSVSTWASPEEEVRVERLANANSVEVVIDGLLSFTADVVPISESEDKVHHYQLPKDDCFAHLNVQFKFYDLTASVDGVLGQTYRPGFQNPVKVGVPMPIMGGENKFRVSSLFATDCQACTNFEAAAATDDSTSSSLAGRFEAKCTSSSTGGGIVCRR